MFKMPGERGRRGAQPRPATPFPGPQPPHRGEIQLSLKPQAAGHRPCQGLARATGLLRTQQSVWEVLAGRSRPQLVHLAHAEEAEALGALPTGPGRGPPAPLTAGPWGAARLGPMASPHPAGLPCTGVLSGHLSDLDTLTPDWPSQWLLAGGTWVPPPWLMPGLGYVPSFVIHVQSLHRPAVALWPGRIVTITPPDFPCSVPTLAGPL